MFGKPSGQLGSTINTSSAAYQHHWLHLFVLLEINCAQSKAACCCCKSLYGVLIHTLQQQRRQRHWSAVVIGIDC
jgi:hypothetical protein